MFNTPENWENLDPKQKQAVRMNNWMNPDIKFASPEAEADFKRKAQMIYDVIQLKKPSSIPILPWMGVYPAEYGGITAKDAMYDFEKMGTAWKKFNKDFMFDGLITCGMQGSGKLFEIVDYKVYKWPSHGTADTTSYQCVEDKYMADGEYQKFIDDPTNYFLRSYLPSAFGALAPLQMLGAFTDFLELPFVGPTLIPFGIPDVQNALKTLLAAGDEAMRWIMAVGATDGESVATLGLPPYLGGATKAPFDTFGDTLRGTKSIMLDMFRHSDKLLEAIDKLVPLAIDMGVRNANATNNPMVFIPLHKGADGFMSDKDFKRFYWPSLKAVIIGLIEEGAIPLLFVEGGYNDRLDVIADPEIPAASTIWMFDKTDMVEARKKLGDWACFGGNVPGSLMKAGTPDEIDAHVKKLISDVAGDGGYILSTGAVIDDTSAENMHAFVNAGRKYGA